MERLQKVMAEAGVASRRKSEEYIVEGRVKVNGVVITELGTKVSEDDYIEVDNRPIRQERKVYILMNKPRNCVTTVSDDRNRPTVMDFVKENGFVGTEKEWLQSLVGPQGEAGPQGENQEVAGLQQQTNHRQTTTFAT